LPYGTYAPRGIVVVYCATHASCVKDDAIRCYCRWRCCNGVHY